MQTLRGTCLWPTRRHPWSLLCQSPALHAHRAPWPWSSRPLGARCRDVACCRTLAHTLVAATAAAAAAAVPGTRKALPNHVQYSGRSSESPQWLPLPRAQACPRAMLHPPSCIAAAPCKTCCSTTITSPVSERACRQGTTKQACDQMPMLPTTRTSALFVGLRSPHLTPVGYAPQAPCPQSGAPAAPFQTC